MGIHKYLSVVSVAILAGLGVCSTFGQSVANLNGSFPVSEWWSVTVYRGAQDVATTFSGTETGTLVIRNGIYTQINHTHATIPSGLDTTETIGYDGITYNISGAYPFSAEGGAPSGIYAVISLPFSLLWFLWDRRLIYQTTIRLTPAFSPQQEHPIGLWKDG